MGLFLLGLNHRSAAVELRERLAFAPEQLAEALNDARTALNLQDVVILSTCNRTEMCGWVEDDEQLACQAAHRWLADYHHVPENLLTDVLYHHTADTALSHLMEVACGLDSMVLGEPQILGQLKQAVADAQQAGTCQSGLLRTFQQVFQIAKRVRTETGIGENPVSVAYAAVDLAHQIFSDIDRCRALLIGAGETIELVAEHLREQGVGSMVVANRTLQRGRDLADRFGAQAVLLAEVPQQLVDADIVIASTASQLPILGKGAVEQALKKRRHRPMLMVDIAVPRDIEPQVGELEDVYLYSVDDLQAIVEENKRARSEEARRARQIIARGVQSFRDELGVRGASDLLRQYRQQAELLRDQELERARRALERGEPTDAVLTALARGLTNKLIHAPTVALRQAAATGEAEQLRWSQQMLGLDAVDNEDSLR